MNSNVLQFKPFTFPVNTENISGISRLFQLQKNEKLYVKASGADEYLYIVKGKVIIAEDGGKAQSISSKPSPNRPFRMPKDSSMIHLTAEQDSIIYHVDNEKLDNLILWSELKQIIDDKHEDINIRVDQLTHSPAFRRLSPNSVCEAVMRSNVIRVKAGDEVIRQGNAGDTFYIIVSGSAEVWASEYEGEDTKKICYLHEGDVFGEDALIMDKPRNATVRMTTNGLLMTLDKKNYLELLYSPRLIEVDVDEAKAKSEQGFKLLDVRYLEENEELRIPGSILIPLNELRQRFSELERGVNYIVYCRSGKRSAVASLLLYQQDFTAFSMKGGIQKWPYEKEGFAMGVK